MPGAMDPGPVDHPKLAHQLPRFIPVPHEPVQHPLSMRFPRRQHSVRVPVPDDAVRYSCAQRHFFPNLPMAIVTPLNRNLHAPTPGYSSVVENIQAETVPAWTGRASD